MPKRSTSFDLATISLDSASAQPLYRQLYDSVRTAVLQRKLSPGTRLPSTRDLCAALHISRNTVVIAFEQLVAEGYLESRIGDGTYVTQAVPDTLFTIEKEKVNQNQANTRPAPAFSQRFQAINHIPSDVHRGGGEIRPFRVGSPGLNEFPMRLWTQLVARHWRQAPNHLLGYGNSAGYPPLRQVIADYLGAARGVSCTPEQVIITNGSQGALNLITLLLLNPDDAVWMENPGYRGARAALLAAGGRVVPVPVDQDGLQVETGNTLCPTARMVYVTPSHQYPVGVTMSLARRLALLEWGKRANAWIIEDDYDSEFRYGGRPLSSLQGLDNRQVLYIGTFSKVLFPALRLGYLVLPETLVDGTLALLHTMQHYLPGAEQAVLADFIAEGHFARHIRQMRLLYAERQHVLIESVRAELGEELSIEPSEAGLHVTGWLRPGVDDQAISAAAQKAGIEAPALSSYSLQPLTRSGLVLGYGGLSVDKIKTGVRGLHQVIVSHMRNS